MMKRYIFAAFAAAAVLAAMSSCTKEQIIPFSDEESSKPITIQASFVDMNTKVSFDPTYDSGKPQKMALAWEDGDKLRVYNHADKTQYSDFELTAGKGTKNGSFSGTPVAATSYDVEIVNGEVTYGTQTQPSDGVTTNLKYMASVQGITNLSTLVFDSVSSVLAITVQMPSTAIAAKIKSVDITASEAIFNGGNTLTIEFETIGDAGNDGILHFFANLPQGDQAIAAGTTLMVKFNAPGETHDVYTRFIELSASTFTADKLNTININASQSDKHAGSPSCDGSSAEKAYLIADKYQLAEISNLLSTESKKYFKLVDDIAVSSWSSIDCDTQGAINLNGNDHEISDLKKPLFSFLDGEISNLNLTNAQISSSGNYYGILARAVTETKSCDIYNVSIINSSLTAGGVVGGLVGRIDSSSSCTLTDCSVDVDVTGTAYYVAGLVGRITKGTVSHCSATGDVTTSTHYASGLIAQVNGEVAIEKCYATGNIIMMASNTANHGGIVAHTVAAGNLTVENCYYTGHMGTTTFKTRRWCGGILGHTASGSTIGVTNCYSSYTIDSANINLEGALVGNNQSTALTCSGFVGWSSLANLRGANTTVSSVGNYLGTEGSIYSQAVALGGWDFVNVWTTDAEPKLR